METFCNAVSRRYDLMDEHIDEISKIESKPESLHTNITNGAIYSYMELDLSRIAMLLKILEFSYEYG